jgi:ubiquinone biosynthesis protein COQ4
VETNGNGIAELIGLRRVPLRREQMDSVATQKASKTKGGSMDEAPVSSIQAPAYERMPLPGPDADIRPRQGMGEVESRYLQGDKLPVTSSVLISNSKYLNNPYYRDAYVTQALRRHGPDLPPTYMVPLMVRAMQETIDYARIAQLLEEEKVKFPAFGAWLEAKHFATFRREDLIGYAAGTLGKEIHDFLSIPGMDMEFNSKHKSAQTDIEFLSKRRGYLHDIEHMVTGFGPNTAGENALAIFNVTQDSRFFTPELAQYMSASSMWISSTGLYRTSLHYHHAMPTYLDAIQQGIAGGLAVRQPIFMIDWESYLDWPLSEIAAFLGFKRGPGSAWDWTTEATIG